MHKLKKLRQQLVGISELPPDILNYIHQQKWLRIWVPKQYGGLGLSFKEGLNILKNLSVTDGSLGWMVTLCGGANYFARNLQPETAMELFKDATTCLGGSGMIGGTADLHKNGYLISGIWNYATGAPHLSHFTLNALLTRNGEPLLDKNGNEQIRSFIIPKEKVDIIPGWKSMGMKATGTYSFKVDQVFIEDRYSFVYNIFFSDKILDRIPFRTFADLTLLVNYLGITTHFVEEAEKIRPLSDTASFVEYLKNVEERIYYFADNTESILRNNEDISEIFCDEIHFFGALAVKEFSTRILELYLQLGIRASNADEPVHQVFCDFFTITQHANFRSYR